MSNYSSGFREMQKSATWRELLGSIIRDTQERQRIANELDVRTITLMRWTNGESNPRLQNLHQLLSVLPNHRETFLELIHEEFPDFSEARDDESMQNQPAFIPAEFYTRVLRTLANIPKVLRFSSLGDLILQQALKHLDPHRSGMAVIVASCLFPSYEGKVRSLRESLGRGLPPWENDLKHQAILLGVESLAGNAVISSRLIVNQNLQENPSLSPGYHGVWEESAAAALITLEGKIAGSLLVSSTQPNYFTSSRQALVQDYADLIALAFHPEDFYEPGCIELGVMPPQAVQLPYLSGFQQRLVDTMLQAARKGQPISITQAEQLVWQDVEEKLLQVSYENEEE
jgi:hypothetical protein